MRLNQNNSQQSFFMEFQSVQRVQELGLSGSIDGQEMRITNGSHSK